jgi:hypothetical protein
VLELAVCVSLQFIHLAARCGQLAPLIGHWEQECWEVICFSAHRRQRGSLLQRLLSAAKKGEPETKSKYISLFCGEREERE